MAHKNKTITPVHVQRVVRKAWTLYCVYEKSQSDVDYHLYLTQRELAEKAIALLAPRFRKDLQLP